MTTSIVTAARIRHWASRFPAAGDIRADDLQLLASVWQRSQGEGRRFALHHLLLAVANHKAERRLELPPLPPPPMDLPAAPDQVAFELEDGSFTVERDEPASWPQLTDRLHGFGVARATALLAAIWPDHHAIIDRRAIGAAVALGITEGVDLPLPDVGSSEPVNAGEWDTYSEVYLPLLRHWAAATAMPMLDVERAMYELGRTVPSEPGARWDAWAARAAQAWAV